MKAPIAYYFILFLNGIGFCQCESSESSVWSSEPLMYENIHSYTPMSDVADVLNIDLDLYQIKKELRKENDTAWINAKTIYSKGGHSKSVAHLTLNEPLQETLGVGSAVSGLAEDGSEIFGMIFETANQDETKVLIQYDAEIFQGNYTGCYVGAIPIPTLEGCFNASGLVTLGKWKYSYNYSPETDNRNYRTIEELSSTAKEEMWSCSHCPYVHYEKFYDYYGEFNYAHRIISRAFYGEEMFLKNGNWNFGYYSQYSLKDFLSKGMSYLSIWMYGISKMEEALGSCVDGEFEEASHFWDEAVAYYTGSRSLIPDKNGDLIFHQAQLRCKEYVTCGEESNSREGIAFVNHESFRHFEDGQNNIIQERCDALKENKDRIVTMMTIPLIQAVLRYAHIISHEDLFYEKHGAEGSVFALSVLPMVHHCNAEDAMIIYENMKSKGTSNVDFDAVKKAFERNYECLNIKCSEIGGIWDYDKGKYKSDAYPCGIDKGASLVWIIGGACTALGIITAWSLFALRSYNLRKMATAQAQNTDSIFKDVVDVGEDDGFHDLVLDDIHFS